MFFFVVVVVVVVHWRCQDGKLMGTLQTESPIIGKYHISSPKIVGIQDGENHFQPGLMICVFFSSVD